MRIVALAGGIGGAKLALGLSRILSAEELAIVGNTGDDIELFGLRVCPDLDTLVYTLSGLVDPERGWGLRGDTFHCLEALRSYGLPGWFQLGDRDLATHLFRTRMLNEGADLVEVTLEVCRRLGVGPRLLPMTNGYHPTFLETDRGKLHLQEYLVREKCRPEMRSIVYRDIEKARIPEAVLQLLSQADGIVICPSNPLISIGPILAVPGFREAVSAISGARVAVSPIVAGEAIKGPAAKMLGELGLPVSAAGVASLYRGLATHFILDNRDAELQPQVERLGMVVSTRDTIMSGLKEKVDLAEGVIELI